MLRSCPCAQLACAMPCTSPRCAIPEGYDLELPGRGTTYVTDVPGPRRRTHRPAAARGRLHRACSPGSPRSSALLAALPRRGVRPALARPRHPERQVLALRLRRRRRPRSSTAGARRRDRGRLLDGLDHRPAGMAPAPGEDRRAGALRDDRPVPQHAVGDGVPPEHGAHDGRRCAASPTTRSAVRRDARRWPREALDVEPTDIHDWALEQFRSTQPLGGRRRPSPRSAGTTRDRGCTASTCPPRSSSPPRTMCSRRRASATAARIPGATIHDIAAGHAACVLQSDLFVPGLLEAVATVHAPAAATSHGRCRTDDW